MTNRKSQTIARCKILIAGLFRIWHFRLLRLICLLLLVIWYFPLLHLPSAFHRPHYRILVRILDVPADGKPVCDAGDAETEGNY